jgi:hypothetical protein
LEQCERRSLRVDEHREAAGAGDVGRSAITLAPSEAASPSLVKMLVVCLLTAFSVTHSC